MSIRINNAWLLPVGASVTDILAGLSTLSATVGSLATTEYAALAGPGKLSAEANLPRFIHLWSKCIIEGATDAYSCSAVVYGHPVGNPIVQFFGVHPLARPAMDGIIAGWSGTDFSWDTSTDDLPPGINRTRYDRRGDVWRRILSGSHVPSRAGLSFDLLDRKTELGVFLAAAMAGGPAGASGSQNDREWWAHFQARDGMRASEAGSTAFATWVDSVVAHISGRPAEQPDNHE